MKISPKVTKLSPKVTKISPKVMQTSPKVSIQQHALKGQKLLAQGTRPWYSCPHAWRPVGAKALYGDPNMKQYCVKLIFNRL